MHLIKNRGFVHPLASEITPRAAYLRRREWLLGGAALALGLDAAAQGKGAKLAAAKSAVPGALVMEQPTSYADATSYNNFYEFGTGKEDPSHNAHTLVTRPWTVAVEGEVKKPKTF